MTENSFQRFKNKMKQKSADRKEAIKKESMQWGFICKECKERSSIWEAGGMRYKAKGEPRIYIKCPKCGVKAMQKVTKDNGQ